MPDIAVTYRATALGNKNKPRFHSFMFLIIENGNSLVPLIRFNLWKNLATDVMFWRNVLLLRSVSPVSAAGKFHNWASNKLGRRLKIFHQNTGLRLVNLNVQCTIVHVTSYINLRSQNLLHQKAMRKLKKMYP